MILQIQSKRKTVMSTSLLYHGFGIRGYKYVLPAMKMGLLNSQYAKIQGTYAVPTAGPKKWSVEAPHGGGFDQFP
jgi:hypothetical protein